MVALNHTSPSAVGTRSTVDHGRTCGCSIGPVGSTCARIHVCASASHDGSVHCSTGTILAMPRAYDVAVVGLGAMGSQAALELASRGRRVLGLDRYRPPPTLGSTHGRARDNPEGHF